MSDFFISNAGVTGQEMLDLVDICRNTTVGPQLYQLYCISNLNLIGECSLLPEKDTAAGKLDCFYISSKTYLDNLYATTGLACAVNCHYPITNDMPSLSGPLDRPASRTYTLPSPTEISGNSNGGNGNSGNNIPLFGPPGGNAASGSLTVTDPNLMFTFVAVFAIMLLIVRKSIHSN
jgi:hypothetical protein